MAKKQDPNVKIVKQIASACAAFLAGVEKTGGQIATLSTNSKLSQIESLAIEIDVPSSAMVQANADAIRNAASAAKAKAKKASKRGAKAAGGKSSKPKKAAKKKRAKKPVETKAAKPDLTPPALPN